MAEETIKPRAITFKEVEKAGGNIDTWKHIGEITGAGHIPINADGNAAIDITHETPAKVQQIDRILASFSETEEPKKGKEK